MTPIPIKIRKVMAAEPFYKTCSRNMALQDHVCGRDPRTGKLIEWEHAFIYAGKQMQKIWAIIPLCWYTHSGPKLNKEINQWIALNRATDTELEEVSKVVDYKRLRSVLNEKYGVYSPLPPVKQPLGINY